MHNSLLRLAWILILTFSVVSGASGQSTLQNPAQQQTLNNSTVSKDIASPVQGKILTIFSYHPGMEWVNSLLAGLEDDLHFLPNIEHYTEFLDARRHPDLAHAETFLKSLGEKYANQQPDVLMVGDDPAFELIKKHAPEIFPGVPVIFFGLNNIRENLPPSFTGIYEVHEAKPTLDIALKLTKASGAAVISTTTPSGIAHERTLDPAIAAYPDLELVIIRDVVSNNLDALQALPDDWPILPMTGLRDGTPNGPLASYAESIEILTTQLPNPMFWSTEILLGKGLVGGYILRAELHSKQALKIAVKVLQGTNPNTIPAITKTPHEWFFDWRELDRRGWIDQTPEAANLLFVRPSFIQRHSEVLAPVAIAMLSLLAVIGALLWQIRIKKRHAVRLNAETQRLATALLAADAGIFEIKANGASVCSDRWIEMISSENQTVDCSSAEWLAQLTDESSAELERLFQRLHDGADREHLEIQIKSTSRLIKLMLIREGNTPETASIVGIGTDETNNRRIERLAASRLRLQSLGQLAGGVAHDFNNLLMAMMINADMIPHESSNDKKDKLAKSIIDAGNRAKAITQRLLTFGSPEEMPKELTEKNINHLLNGTHGLLKDLAKKCNVSLKLYDAPLMCKVCPAAMDQILTNLVINARDAMEGQGDIVIETAKSESEMGAPLAVLRVRDSGAGMDSDTLEHLFEPFFSTKGEGHGTGLGLSTVYGLVSASNGTISVESSKEHGSTFEISWPLQHVTQDELKAVHPPTVPTNFH